MPLWHTQNVNVCFLVGSYSHQVIVLLFNQDINVSIDFISLLLHSLIMISASLQMNDFFLGFDLSFSYNLGDFTR